MKELRPLFLETFLIIMEHPYHHQHHISETHVKLEQEDLSSFEAMVSETFPSSYRSHQGKVFLREGHSPELTGKKSQEKPKRKNGMHLTLPPHQQLIIQD